MVINLSCVGEKTGLELADYFLIKVWDTKSFKHDKSFANGKKGFSVFNISSKIACTHIQNDCHWLYFKNICHPFSSGSICLCRPLPCDRGMVLTPLSLSLVSRPVLASGTWVGRKMWESHLFVETAVCARATEKETHFVVNHLDWGFWLFIASFKNG